MDEFDFDFVWTDYYFQPACRACEQCMPNGTNKCAWCQLVELHDSGKRLVSVCSVGVKNVTRGDWLGWGWRWRFGAWGDGWQVLWIVGRVKKHDAVDGEMFLFFTFLYLRWHEKEMHVREMMREWQEKERQTWRKCYLHVFPFLWACSLHVFCVSPPRQHGKAPNQALLQPQHLCVGQTVSGAAQVADVPSHERGSRNARQEAQCAWERQLCKLRRDVWQHLTLPHPPSAPLSLPSPLPFLFLPIFLLPCPLPLLIPVSSLLFLDWQVHVDCTCLIDMRRIWPLTATNFSVIFSFPPFWQRMICPYHFRQSDLVFINVIQEPVQTPSLCTVRGVIWWHFKAPEI